MINFLILLWALFLVAVLIILFKTPKKIEFDFQNFGVADIPYITMDIQGHLLNMIVDTGCGISFINLPALEKYNLEYTKTERKASVSALTPDSVEAGAVTIDFFVDTNKVSEDFFIVNHEDMGNFMRLYGIEMHGLLGSSFFDKYNCKVDYKNNKLIIP